MSKNIKILEPKIDIEGVKYSVALKIKKMLEDGRRYFGSSGASLTQQIYNPIYKDSKIDPTLAKIGLEGERDTTLMLKQWMKDKPNVVLIDSVHVVGYGKEEVNEETGMIEAGDTDHILIIGNEVILIDTKRWKSKKNYQVGDNGQVLRSNKDFEGGNIHMKEAIYLWLDYLDEDASIMGIVHINADEITVYRNKNWYDQPYRLVEKEKFIQLLDEKWQKILDDNEDEDGDPIENNSTFINTTLVSQVALNAIKPFDVRSKVFDMETLSNFK